MTTQLQPARAPHHRATFFTRSQRSSMLVVTIVVPGPEICLSVIGIVVANHGGQQAQHDRDHKEKEAQRYPAETHQRRQDDPRDFRKSHAAPFQESKLRKRRSGSEHAVTALAAYRRGSLRESELRCSEAAPEARQWNKGDGWRVQLDAHVKNTNVNIGHNKTVVKPNAFRVTHMTLNADSNRTLKAPKSQEIFSMICNSALQSAFQLMYITYRQPVAGCDSQVFKSIMDRPRQGLSVISNDQGARWSPWLSGSALTAGAQRRRVPLQPNLPTELD